jgi:hypothetical protein
MSAAAAAAILSNAVGGAGGGGAGIPSNVAAAGGRFYDDGVRWGPSGGNERESMRRRNPWQPMMAGAARPAAYSASPYSRTFIAAWSEFRNNGTVAGATADKHAQSSTGRSGSLSDEKRSDEARGAPVSTAANTVLPPSTSRTVETERRSGVLKVEVPEAVAAKRQQQAGKPEEDDQDSVDDGPDGFDAQRGVTGLDPQLLLAVYGDSIHPTCPRALFAGKSFFMNAIAPEPGLPSAYHIEHLIRYFGGGTSMAVNGRTSFVLSQQLASAKSKLLFTGGNAQSLKKKMTSLGEATVAGPRAAGDSGARRAPLVVLPRYVMECLKAGRLVDPAPFLTKPPQDQFAPNPKKR